MIRSGVAWSDIAFADPRPLFRDRDLVPTPVGDRGKLDVTRLEIAVAGARVALQRIEPGPRGHEVVHPHGAPVIVVAYPRGLYRHGFGDGTFYATRAAHAYVVNRTHWIEALEAPSFSVSVWAPAGAPPLAPSFMLPEPIDGLEVWLERMLPRGA